VDSSSPYRTESAWEIEQSPWNKDEYYIAAIKYDAADPRGGLYLYNFAEDKLTELGLANQDTADIACDFDNNTIQVYILTRPGEVFLFDGASFVQKTNVPGSLDLKKIDVIKPDCLSKMIYVSGGKTATKVYRSTDSGSTWQQYADGLPGGVNKIAYNSDFSKVISAGNSSGPGVYIDSPCQPLNTFTHTFTPSYTPTRTQTSTRTYTSTSTHTHTSTPTPTIMQYPCSGWQAYMQAGVEVGSVEYIGEKNGKSVIVTGSWGSDEGVSRVEYDQNGKTISQIYGLRDFTDFLVNPDDSNVVFAGNWDGKIYRFDNVMAVPTVTVLKTFGTQYIVVSLAIDEGGTGRMMSANYTGIYKSPDFGATWSLVDSGNSLNQEAAWQVEQSPWNHDVYYIVGTKFDGADPRGGIYRYTWSSDNLELIGLETEDTSSLAFDRLSASEKFFVACRDGKFFEYSGGVFTRKSDTQPAGTSATNGIKTALCSGTQYIFGWSAGAGVYVSSDNGNSWDQFNTGLTAGVVKMHLDEYRGMAMAMQNSSGGVYVNGLCCFSVPTASYTMTATPVFTQMATHTSVNTATHTQTYTPSNTSTLSATPTLTNAVVPISTYTSTPVEPMPRPTVDEGDSEPCPNVGKESVKIVFNINKKAECRVFIYDFSGKLVDDYDITIGDTPNEKLYQLKIDTSRYAPGVYYYAIQGKDKDGNKIEFKSKKFMIKR